MTTVSAFQLILFIYLSEVFLTGCQPSVAYVSRRQQFLPEQTQKWDLVTAVRNPCFVELQTRDQTTILYNVFGFLSRLWAFSQPHAGSFFVAVVAVATKASMAAVVCTCWAEYGPVTACFSARAAHANLPFLARGATLRRWYSLVPNE